MGCFFTKLANDVDEAPAVGTKRSGSGRNLESRHSSGRGSNSKRLNHSGESGNNGSSKVSLGNHTGTTAGSNSWRSRDMPPVDELENSNGKGTPSESTRPLSEERSNPKKPSQKKVSNHSSGSEGSLDAYKSTLMPAGVDKKVYGSDNLVEFRVDEIRRGTEGFSTRLGEGGFGLVYKGSMDVPGEGEVEVAVKVLKQDSSQGFKEWQREVKFLGELKHDHLVRLYGYCSEGDDCMLVYEFVKGGSFDRHMFPYVAPNKSPKISTLSFRKRVKVLLGAAEGLLYLHEAKIIYRDFKTSNILINEDFHAKLSDFGLAREGPESGQTHVSTDIVGTSGYLAPEYIQSGHASERCDVYSFGVVMLEVVTGCRVSKYPEKNVPLLEWVFRKVDSEAEGWKEIVDQRLKENYSGKAVKIILAASRMCISDDPYARPTMSKIVHALKVSYQHALQASFAKQQGRGKYGSMGGRTNSSIDNISVYSES